MNHNYEKLFSVLSEPEPPAGLTEKVLLTIGRRERRVLGFKIAASACAFGVSVGIAIAGYISLVAALSRSGFFSIAPLIFSDFGAMVSNFPDFAFSIVETFPIFTMALLLSGVLFAVWSMALLIDEASLFRARKFFAS